MTALWTALRRWLRRARARRRVRSRMILPCLALAAVIGSGGCGDRPAKHVFCPDPVPVVLEPDCPGGPPNGTVGPCEPDSTDNAAVGR